MNTSKIIKAEVLRHMSADVYKVWRKNFCETTVQPFIDAAADACVMLAKNGYTAYTSSCQHIKTGGDEEKAFKEEVYGAFTPFGYKVSFPQRSKGNIAVILQW